MYMQRKNRPNMIHLRATDDELEQIQHRMQANGFNNLSDYLRKMAMTGYVLKLDLPEIRELISLLRNMTNNLNQLTKRVNSGGKHFIDLSAMTKDDWAHLQSSVD